MLASCPNDVKVYDLSRGKSLPEWISDRKRRRMLQQDVDLRRRVELIQDFEMPDCSNHVCFSKNGDYIFVAGVYKPRIRCYEVNNLSMKFERCLDAEPFKTIPLSDGYEKFILLEEDRWVEFHVQYGHYHRLRLPKFCRDGAYIDSVSELYTTGSGSDIYRVNLELGRLMTPLTTDASSLTTCDVNPVHQLFVCGTVDGEVEAWDPRSQKRVGRFQTAPERQDLPIGADSSVSALKFKDGLNLGVGTGWGQIFMYDIRSNAPVIVKDHQYDLPIISIDFCSEPDALLTVDNKVLKIWRRDSTAATIASIEPGLKLSGMCPVPRTGLLFMPNEGQKVYTYYVPALGPAPKWCTFLDHIVEELEETETPAVYDDYKFVSTEELEQLGLSNLIGTNMLRAYMHGYFCDARLYNKAKALTNPFAFEEYQKKKIREKLEEQRTHHVIPVKKLPKVNRQLAERLMAEEDSAKTVSEDVDVVKTRKSKKLQKKKAEAAASASLLKDDRFRALFENPEFEVNPEEDDIGTLNPVFAKLNQLKNKANKLKEDEKQQQRDRARHELEARINEVRDSPTSSDSDIMEVEEDEKESSSDDDDDRVGSSVAKTDDKRQPRIMTLKTGEEFRGWKFETNNRQQINEKRRTLGERLEMQGDDAEATNLVGNAREMAFGTGRKKREEIQAQKLAEHKRERRQARRSVRNLSSKGGSRRK